MATVVFQRAVIDGYDVRLTTGETLHFGQQPTDDELSEALLRHDEIALDAILAEENTDELFE